MAAEHRINLDFLWTQIDLFKKVHYATDNNTINAPAGALFVRGVEVFNSTATLQVLELG